MTISTAPLPPSSLLMAHSRSRWELGSRVARICLSHSESEILVEVQDNGLGISAEKQAEMEQAGATGVGIRGMRERLRQLRGTLEVRPAPNGTGTVVIARLPVSRASVDTIENVQHLRDEPT